MFRIVCVMAVIGLLLFGFLPQPFLSPDWKTLLEKAIDTNDCDAVERIVDVLNETGHEGEFYSTAAMLGAAKKCRFAEMDARSVKSAKTLGEEWSHGSNSLNSMMLRSPLMSRMLYAANLQPHSKDPNFRNAVNRLQEVSHACRDKFPAGSYGGIPNSKLLKYALKNPSLLDEDIGRIAYEQRALCAHEFVQIAKLLEVSARTRAELDLAADTLGLTLLYLRFAPMQNWNFSIVQESLMAKGAEGHFLTEEAILADGGNAECRENQLAAADLWSAGACAETMASGSSKHAVNALFFARRAKRLGWHDVDAAEEAAAKKLSPECVAAMIDLEAKEAGNARDPRDFRRLDWPVGPGEACEMRAN